MKVRTSLLFACMIVVPGLAMFSHRVPAEVRTATRCALWDPLLAWAEGWSKPADTVGGELAAGGPIPAAAEQLAVAASPVAPASGFARAGDRASPSAPPVADAGGRLAALGASAVECRPLDPRAGTHVASCRVAMDASGQLHRVFQAAGTSPEQAVSSLAEQVERWRGRLASRAEEPGTRIR
ncbi:MAG: hypothetical protein RLZZ440_740 [Planctomycetota bacterium]